MTTMQITLPDGLTQTTVGAGLLSPEGMAAMLLMQLRRRGGGEKLLSMWQRLPLEEPTPEIEQGIVEAMRKVRAEQRVRDELMLVHFAATAVGASRALHGRASFTKCSRPYGKKQKGEQKKR